MTLEQRFWSRVRIGTGCWVWIGLRDKDGYGKIVRAGKNGPGLRAHRLAWELLQGFHPGQMKVLHRCDNPSCVSPFHLFLGTTADNQQDMKRKGRSTRGERSTLAKLTETQAREIVTKRWEGASYKSLMAEYGMSKPAISHIVRGRSWPHIPRPARFAMIEKP